MPAVKAIGCLLFVLVPFFAIGAFTYWRIAPGAHNLKSLLILMAVMCLPFCLLGIGLLYGRKSAAIITMLGFGAYASCLIVGSIIQVPLPWTLINIIFGGVILIPAVILIKNWRHLKGW